MSLFFRVMALRVIMVTQFTVTTIKVMMTRMNVMIEMTSVVRPMAVLLDMLCHTQVSSFRILILKFPYFGIVSLNRY